MHTWNVTLRPKGKRYDPKKQDILYADDPDAPVEQTTLTGDFDTVADVEKYAEKNWQQFTFVKAEKAKEVHEAEVAPANPAEEQPRRRSKASEG